MVAVDVKRSSAGIQRILSEKSITPFALEFSTRSSPRGHSPQPPLQHQHQTAHEVRDGRQLAPISPTDAVDWYLQETRDEKRVTTRRKHESSLESFLEWADEVGLYDMTEVGGRELMAFKTWLKSDAELKTISLNGNLGILQVFLRFCANIDAVPEDLVERVPLPTVPDDEEIRDDAPDDSSVEVIREYLEQFEYACRRHIEFELVAEVGIRLGAVRAIDLADYQPDTGQIYLVHRPEGIDEVGTPLKNGNDGERYINLSPRLQTFIDDYIETNRHDVTDVYGREPLLTTANGRPSTATIRRDFYKLTRPCIYANECPHDRVPATCDAATSTHASQCPSSFSPHPLRKWAIMHQLDAGIRKERLSDRADVSVPILDKHYDHRSEERKSERRREELETKLDVYDSPPHDGER